MADATTGDSQSTAQHPAIWIAISSCCGILTDGLFDFPIAVYISVAVLATLAAIIFGGFGNHRFRNYGFGRFASGNLDTSQRMKLTFLFAVTVFICAGAAWHHVYWNLFPKNEISRFCNRDSAAVYIEATLLTEPRKIASQTPEKNLNRPRDLKPLTRARIRCRSIRNGSTWMPCSGRVTLTAPESEMALHAGDRVRIVGRLRRINPPTNPGSFDFRNFYRQRRILAAIYCPQSDSIEVVKRSQSGAWQASLRDRLNNLAWQHLPPQQASLASAILLGNREQLTTSRREAFLRTGTVHLLAISGLHVGILACCFFFLFRCGWLSRSVCLILTIAFVLFYAWLVEFRPPVVRASILIVLFCIARVFGRSGLSSNVLALAALLVLAINPTDLFSLGTQLSFLAVAAIGFGNQWIFNHRTDPLQQLIAVTRPWPIKAFQAVKENLRAAFVISGLIWLISIPLVAINFHVLAPVGLFANPLILLPIAIALYAGISIFIFGDLLSIVARFAAVVCAGSLGLIETFVNWAGDLPLSHFWTPGPSWLAVMIFYIGWVIFGLFPPTRISVGRLCLLGILWLIFGWFTPAYVGHLYRSQIQRSLTTTFIDVGHGTSVLLQLPNDKNILYDCGSTTSSRFAANCVSDVLWHKGISHIEAIIVSHADIDHFNAIPALSKRFSIGKVYLSPAMNEHPSPSVGELKRALAAAHVDIAELSANDSIHIDSSTRIKAIAPSPDLQHSNDNSASIVLTVEYQNQRILLPGDLEKEGLEQLLATPAGHFDLVMAAHHGSSHSSPLRFCHWATPKYLAVSCGSGKFSAQTADAARQCKCRLLRTDRHGAIEFEIRKDGSTTFESFLEEE